MVRPVTCSSTLVSMFFFSPNSLSTLASEGTVTLPAAQGSSKRRSGWLVGWKARPWVCGRWRHGTLAREGTVMLPGTQE